MNQNCVVHSQSQVSHVVSEGKENLREKDHRRRTKSLGRSWPENLSHGESITGSLEFPRWASTGSRQQHLSGIGSNCVSRMPLFFSSAYSFNFLPQPTSRLTVFIFFYFARQQRSYSLWSFIGCKEFCVSWYWFGKHARRTALFICAFTQTNFFVFYGSAHTAFALKDGILCAQMISCQVCYSYSIGKSCLQRNHVVNCFQACLVNLAL